MKHRFLFLVFLWLFATIGSPAFAQLTAADVQRVIDQAVDRAVRISPNSVIAVTDHEGYVLGVWVVRGGAATPGEIATAVKSFQLFRISGRIEQILFQQLSVLRLTNVSARHDVGAGLFPVGH